MKKSVFLASLFFLSTLLVTGQEKKLTIDLSLGSMKYLVDYGYFDDFRLEGRGTGIDIRLNQSWYGLSIGYWNYHDIKTIENIWFTQEGYMDFEVFRKKTFAVQLHGRIINHEFFKLSLNAGIGRSFTKIVGPDISVWHPEYEMWFNHVTFSNEPNTALIYGFELGFFPTKYGMPIIRGQYFDFLNSSKSGMAMIELGVRFRIVQ